MTLAASPTGENHEESPAQETRESIALLARSILAARPLIDVLEPPVRLAPPGPVPVGAPLERLVNEIASRIGAPALALGASQDLTVFENIVSAHLYSNGLDRVAAALAASPVPELDPAVLDGIADDAMRRSFNCRFGRTEVRARDGASLNVYTAGARSAEPVIILSACGIPASLSERWIEILARDYFVLTWETRGLFGPMEGFDSLACDVGAQARDLFAVMDHFDLAHGHLIGLCGGAVVALRAAAENSERLRSLTLCYGDFELSGAPRTIFQQNLKAVMDLAGAGRAEAKSIYDLFCESMVKSARPGLAHLILYPFASAELLYRYARLNGSIMNEKIEDLLEKISRPALVITSEADHTAHPEGSRQVAARIPGAALHVEPQGDHLSFYEAAPHLTALVMGFLAQART